MWLGVAGVSERVCGPVCSVESEGGSTENVLECSRQTEGGSVQNELVSSVETRIVL